MSEPCEESVLDYVAHCCIKLANELSTAKGDDEKDRLVIEHIKTVWSNTSKTQPIGDFNKNLTWINVSRPITLREDCSNKIVVLDFFTYCCINCYHILGDLRELEDRHRDGKLVVIGVHSAKFDNERDTAMIEQAVLRYNIQHPVVNDADGGTWNKLGIMCWPTLLILGPQNRPLFVITGEGHRDELLYYADMCVQHFDDQLSTVELPLKLHNQIAARDETNLYFPSKLAINPFYKGNANEPYIAISDSGNHRILLTDYSGLVVKVVGGPDPGFKDGEFSQAQLNSPQGLCWLSGTVLAVCDTGNHAIRTIHLDVGHVELLAGDGSQTAAGDMGGRCLSLQQLSSPWDIILYTSPDMDLSVRTKLPGQQQEDKEASERNKSDELRRVLLIAMAGSHQIWALFMDPTIWWKYRKYNEGTCICIIGSGQEAARNSSYPAAAALAQPSGLALRHNSGSISGTGDLFVADSESSSIRRIALQGGQVTTLAGGDKNPQNLFAYGDTDGVGFEAKFQHPMSVAYSESQKSCYVADTYNHKIKKIDLSTSRVTTLSFTNPESSELITFNEPNGLALTQDQKYLYVADTNNHSIKILNLNKLTSEPFKVKFVHKPKPPENLIVYNNELFVNRKMGVLIIFFNVNLDNLSKNIKISENAPQHWNVVIRDEKLEDVTDQFEFMNCSQSGSSLPGRVEMKLKCRTDKNCFKMDLSFRMNLCEGCVCFVHRFTVRSNILVRDSVKMIESYKVTCRVKPDSSAAHNNSAVQ